MTKAKKHDIIIKLSESGKVWRKITYFGKSFGNLKKILDKARRKWYNNKAVERERAREKKNKNFFKKRLDKFEGKWYNIKVVSKETGIQKSLKKLEKSTWQTEKNVVKY